MEEMKDQIEEVKSTNEPKRPSKAAKWDKSDVKEELDILM